MYVVGPLGQVLFPAFKITKILILDKNNLKMGTYKKK